MKKTKVLHVIGKMNREGAQTFIMNVFREIDRSKFQFDFLVNSKDFGEYSNEVLSLGGNFIYIDPPNKYNILSYVSNVKKIITKNGPYDAVHTHMQLFNGIISLAAKKANVPRIISHSHSASGNDKSIIRNLYKHFMKSLIMNNSTEYVSCSMEAANYLYGKGKEKSIILQNGLNLNYFYSQINPINIRNLLNIPNHGLLLVQVGRLQKVKNHEFSIKLIKNMIDRGYDVYLLIVGDGHLKSDLVHLCNSYQIKDNVKFLGVRDDVPSILKESDLLIHPSLYEGIPLVLVESQATPILSIVSDTVDSSVDLGLDLIKFLPIEDSINEWIDAIVTLSDTELPNEHEILRKLDSAGYNIRTVTKKMEDLYRENTL